MKKTTVISIILTGLSVILGIVSLIFLPDTVIVQFSTGGGAVTVMPKPAAVAIPAALGIGGAVGSLLLKPDTAGVKKAFIVSIVGIAVYLIMLAVNCI